MEHKEHKEMQKKMSGSSHEMPKASDMDMNKMHKEMGTEHTMEPKKHKMGND